VGPRVKLGYSYSMEPCALGSIVFICCQFLESFPLKNLAGSILRGHEQASRVSYPSAGNISARYQTSLNTFF
jgi:hypothetical protein